MRAKNSRNDQRRPQLSVVLPPVSLNQYRAAKQRLSDQQHLINERLEINGMIAERVIENWDNENGGFNREYFYWLLSRVSEQTAFSIDQAKQVLPALLQVNDEIERLLSKGSSGA